MTWPARAMTNTDVAERISKMRIYVTSLILEFYFKTIPAKMSSTLSILLVCPWSGWVPFVREYLSMVADRACGSLPNALLAKSAERVVNWGWCAT